MKNLIKKITATTLVIGQIILASSNILAVTKEETVYSKLDTTGKSYQTVVSDHIKNTEYLEEIKDLSDLLEIENLSEDNTYTQNGNVIVWNAKGKDIYYNGKSEKELPIEVKMTYTLDGKEISPEELSGKSGKLNIKIEYTNKAKHYVEIDGQYVEMYTPFVIFAGTYFKNETVQNVKVTTGKAVDDGSKTIVIGMALPGLQTSLGLDKDTFEIPENIEIEMDVTNYEQSSIITFVTPKIIDKEDFNILDELDTLYSSVDTLQSSMDQIEEGAKALSEGTALYSENYNTFNSAIGMLNDGTTTLKENYEMFNNGVQTANEGAKQLNEGMQQLNTAAESIKDVVYTVIDWLQTAMNTLVTPLKSLQQTILEDIDAVIAMVDNISNPSQENIEYINGLNYQAIQDLYTENANLEALKEGADEETVALFDEQIATNNNVIAILEQNNAQTLYQNIDPEQIASVREKLVEIRGKVESSELTVEELEEKVQNIINEVYAAFDGINALAQGTEQLAQGTEQLATASSQINDGIVTLNESTEQLAQASTQLNDASVQISDGAKQLYDGIAMFNNEGIRVLTSKVNNDVRGISVRLDKLMELSKEYNNFSNIDSSSKGDLRFIMISDAIKLK